jgi:glycosyltransferase involved in cell wall biosynthesis
MKAAFLKYNLAGDDSVISILMAAYNGEKYIKEQLDSLMKQTFQDFTIIIQDDCSQDKTLQIIESYSKAHPNRISFSTNKKNTGSPKHTFFNLLLHHKDDYIMLCDQDDIWNRDKIEITFNEMKRMEKIHGQETPILVHTDLTVVDNNLNLINKSYRKMLDANYSRTRLNHLLSQNTLTGCTAIMNRSLCNLIISEPKYCVMHDWWIVLVASCFGVISSLDVQTVQYRQHDNNSVGVSDVKSLGYQFHKMFRSNEIRIALDTTYLQAQCFLDTYSEKLENKQVELIKKYVEIPSQSKIKRVKILFQEDFLKNTFARKIAHILMV